MKNKRHKRKKMHPVTTIEKPPQSKKDKRKLISALHNVLKEMDKVKHDSYLQPAAKAVQIQECEQKITELGGLEAYQQSFLQGEHLHGNVNICKWVLQKLKEFKVKAVKGSKLTLLDVGALQLNYTKHTKWLVAEAIDLNPWCEGIVKTDFMDYKLGESALYDIIVLSLMLNFVSSPSQRGEVLRRCRDLCKEGGHVFVVLPRACLENSRYLNQALFGQIMNRLTFDLVIQHTSKKLSYLMFRKVEGRKGERRKAAFPKQEVRNGTKCNNFSIVLR